MNKLVKPALSTIYGDTAGVVESAIKTSLCISVARGIEEQLTLNLHGDLIDEIEVKIKLKDKTSLKQTVKVTTG